MKLHIDDRFLSFVYSDKREELLVRKHFTYPDYSLVYTRGKFNSNLIRQHCFVKNVKKHNFLFSGFLQELLMLCKKNKFHIDELEDKRTRFDFQMKEFSNEEIKNVLPDFEYVEHQTDTLKKLLRISTGIVKAPTSSGKSESMIAFLKLTKLPALILVNRVSLAVQLVDRMRDNGITNVGICHGKGKTDGDIMVSTIGSVKKILNLHRFKVLIVDESHRACASQFQDFFETVNMPIKLGMSATPEGNDKYKFATVRQFLGSIVYEIDPITLIDKKVIALPHIHFVKVQGEPTISWQMAYDRSIVNNLVRNQKIVELVKQHNVPTLILVRMLEHGRILNEEVGENISGGSIFLSGIDDAEVRKETIKDFENGNLQIIIATSIFDEGISINAIRLLIIASAGKSKIQAIQRLGRALRTTKEKHEVLIYDFDDLNNRFTSKHSQIRKNTYRKFGFDYTAG